MTLYDNLIVSLVPPDRFTLVTVSTGNQIVDASVSGYYGRGSLLEPSPVGVDCLNPIDDPTTASLSLVTVSTGNQVVDGAGRGSYGKRCSQVFGAAAPPEPGSTVDIDISPTAEFTAAEPPVEPGPGPEPGACGSLHDNLILSAVPPTRFTLVTVSTGNQAVDASGSGSYGRGWFWETWTGDILCLAPIANTGAATNALVTVSTGNQIVDGAGGRDSYGRRCFAVCGAAVPTAPEVEINVSPLVGFTAPPEVAAALTINVGPLVEYELDFEFRLFIRVTPLVSFYGSSGDLFIAVSPTVVFYSDPPSTVDIYESPTVTFAVSIGASTDCPAGEGTAAIIVSNYVF